MNWKGRPLVSYEAVVNLIGNTKTRTGLKVKAMLDKNSYETGQRISDEEMQELRLKVHLCLLFNSSAGTSSRRALKAEMRARTNDEIM